MHFIKYAFYFLFLNYSVKTFIFIHKVFRKVTFNLWNNENVCQVKLSYVAKIYLLVLSQSVNNDWKHDHISIHRNLYYMPVRQLIYFKTFLPTSYQCQLTCIAMWSCIIQKLNAYGDCPFTSPVITLWNRLSAKVSR